MIEKAEDITYEVLKKIGNETAYTDHIHHFEALFNIIKPKTFLEWGCGFSTKLFLDASEKVISIEIKTPATSDVWFHQCEELYKDYPNWTPVLYKASDEMCNACTYQCATHKDYNLIDREIQPLTSYIQELDFLIKDLIKTQDITISFVDANVYIRGDMAELSLQNKIPIVVAHDFANFYPDYPSLIERQVETGLYGWFKIKEHSDYEKIFIDYGNGTVFWILKDYSDLIEKMKLYKNNFKAGD